MTEEEYIDREEYNKPTSSFALKKKSSSANCLISLHSVYTDNMNGLPKLMSKPRRKEADNQISLLDQYKIEQQSIIKEEEPQTLEGIGAYSTDQFGRFKRERRESAAEYLEQTSDKSVEKV